MNTNAKYVGLISLVLLVAMGVAVPGESNQATHRGDHQDMVDPSIG